LIFLTVGTQLPFDRLVMAVDNWAGMNADVKVFAQIGPSKQAPVHLEYVDFIGAGKVDDLMQQAELIIAHAGMGSIVSALRYQRPIVILPRRAELREHRNDHQLATAKWLASRPGVHVAWDAAELLRLLERRRHLPAGPPLAPDADGPLVDRLKAFVHENRID
jgi:UDP-N-acetylglucosamine transferase subunit ALG13